MAVDSWEFSNPTWFADYLSPSAPALPPLPRDSLEPIGLWEAEKISEPAAPTASQLAQASWNQGISGQLSLLPLHCPHSL